MANKKARDVSAKQKMKELFGLADAPRTSARPKSRPDNATAKSKAYTSRLKAGGGKSGKIGTGTGG